MKKSTKLVAKIVVSAMLILSLAGCSFSVGNTGSKESYKDLFPDKAATLDKSYKTSEVGYNFTVGDGKMMVYVDTSEGHKFEVINEPAGFKITDKDGNDALYAVCMERDQYEQYSARCEEVKKINGRDFLYVYNAGDGSEDCYSYMADCGMDYGLVLEVHDGNTDNFSLVSFRGEALEGASSDVYYYQGTADYYDEYFDENADLSDVSQDELKDSEVAELSETGNDEININSGSELTTYAVSDEVKDMLSKLDTDFSKVMWGAVYSMGEDFPGIVASITPYYADGEYYLIVGITNLYDSDFSFSASAQALGDGDAVVGDTYIYCSCVGSCNTYINVIPCGENYPDGRIHWEDISISDPFGTYVPWVADYSLTGKPSDGYVTATYQMSSTDKSAFNADAVNILLLSEDGFVIGYGCDYAYDEVENGSLEGSADIFGDEETLKMTKGLAIFSNPYRD